LKIADWRLNRVKFPAGDYKHHVTIQKNQPTIDASRRKVDNWILFAPRKARRPAPSRTTPIVITDANRSEITSVIFRVRLDSMTSQIDSNFQLLYQGKPYKIESAVDPEGDGDEIELTCKAREFDK
jgi:head-tail adaptor